MYPGNPDSGLASPPQLHVPAFHHPALAYGVPPGVPAHEPEPTLPTSFPPAAPDDTVLTGISFALPAFDPLNTIMDPQATFPYDGVGEPSAPMPQGGSPALDSQLFDEYFQF